MIVFRPTVSYVDTPSLVFVAIRIASTGLSATCVRHLPITLLISLILCTQKRSRVTCKIYSKIRFSFIFRVRTRVKLVQRPIYLDLSSMKIGQIRKIGRVKIFGDIFMYEGSQVTRGFNLEFSHFCRDSRLDW